MAETAGSVQFGLTLSPLDRALQPSTEEALQQVEEENSSRDEQMEEEREDVRDARVQRRRGRGGCMVGKMGGVRYGLRRTV